MSRRLVHLIFFFTELTYLLTNTLRWTEGWSKVPTETESRHVVEGPVETLGTGGTLLEETVEIRTPLHGGPSTGPLPLSTHTSTVFIDD